eukprot:GHVL01003993.1.p2 GENE.GHVL01003993.1~~GHVL01003993.1.p2  ORF type:complete len:153 (-),score=16.08 GHVL01003993.1:106-564(-)
MPLFLETLEDGSLTFARAGNIEADSRIVFEELGRSRTVIDELGLGNVMEFEELKLDNMIVSVVELDSRIELELDSRIESLVLVSRIEFVELESKIESRSLELESKIESRSLELESTIVELESTIVELESIGIQVIRGSHMDRKDSQSSKGLK